jgi:four helix bundle protein
MNENDLKKSTKSIAIAVGKLCEKLISNKINNTYTGQILRSSASIGANYRAACRAKSLKDFINKLRIVEEEADETLYFLELLAAFNEEYKAELRSIYQQTESVLKIIVASIRTSVKKLEDNDRKTGQKISVRSESKI